MTLTPPHNSEPLLAFRLSFSLTPNRCFNLFAPFSSSLFLSPRPPDSEATPPPEPDRQPPDCYLPGPFRSSRGLQRPPPSRGRKNRPSAGGQIYCTPAPASLSRSARSSTPPRRGFPRSDPRSYHQWVSKSKPDRQISRQLQHQMAEEHKCQSPPEGPRLCANNCGFFGSPATLDLCSKCYRDYRLKEEQASSAKMAVEMAVEKSFLSSNSAAAPPPPPSAAPVAAAVPPVVDTPPAVTLEEPAAPVAVVEEQQPAADPAPAPAADVAAVQQPPSQPPQPTRCSSCRKRVGLTGFRCRCGETFCGSHRYPEHHSCTFDFKSAGKDAIARANPVVKARKLDKI